MLTFPNVDIIVSIFDQTAVKLRTLSHQTYSIMSDSSHINKDSCHGILAHVVMQIYRLFK